MQNMERTSIDWKALADLLENVGYQPIIIVGYRRLGEILPSAKQQWDQEGGVCVGKWPKDGGRILQPLFPNVLNDPRLLTMDSRDSATGTIQNQTMKINGNEFSGPIPITCFKLYRPTCPSGYSMCTIS